MPPSKPTEGTATLEAAPWVNVPEANRRVVPGEPMIAPATLPPPPKLSVAVWISMAPGLSSATAIELVAVPADFRRVPALLKVPLPTRGTIDSSDWASHRPSFWITAPPPTRRDPVPPQAALFPAGIRRVRGFRSLKLLPEIERPPDARVVPPPVIAPAVQEIDPATSTRSVPPSVPPERTSVAGAIVSPLEKIALPEEIASALPIETSCAVAPKVALDPLRVVPVVAVYAPLTATVPPSNSAASTLTLEAAVNV